jgi:hypothetical protein
MAKYEVGLSANKKGVYLKEDDRLIIDGFASLSFTPEDKPCRCKEYEAQLNDVQSKLLKLYNDYTIMQNKYAEITRQVESLLK